MDDPRLDGAMVEGGALSLVQEEEVVVVEEEEEPAWLRVAEGRLKEDAREWSGRTARHGMVEVSDDLKSEGAEDFNLVLESEDLAIDVDGAEADRMLSALLHAGVADLACVEIGRLLAISGRWQQLVEVVPAELAVRLLYSEGVQAQAGDVGGAEPVDVEKVLRLIVERAKLAPESVPLPTSTWAGLLGALGPDDGDHSCGGGRMLLRLALLSSAANTVQNREGLVSLAAALQVSMSECTTW